MTAQEEASSNNSEDAARVLRNHVIATAAAGLVPNPLLNIGVLYGIQLRMLKKLAAVYEVEFAEQRANSFIGALAGTSVRVTSQGLLNLLGRTIAAFTGPVLPAATTYSLGKVFIRHFESGGTFLTFDPKRAKEEFDEEVDAGERVITTENYAGIKP